MIWYRPLSSAYIVMLLWDTELAIQLMCIKNSSGPNTILGGHLTQQEATLDKCLGPVRQNPFQQKMGDLEEDSL